MDLTTGVAFTHMEWGNMCGGGIASPHFIPSNLVSDVWLPRAVYIMDVCAFTCCLWVCRMILGRKVENRFFSVVHNGEVGMY